MTRPLFNNRCGHDKYERCHCAVCYPRTAFVETMMRAASERKSLPTPQIGPSE